MPVSVDKAPLQGQLVQVRTRYWLVEETSPLPAGTWLRLANVDGDLAREPQRIAEFHRIKSFRLEPVGLAYPWPITG